MSEKISRREFLKKSGILGAGLFFAFSKFGNMPAVKAAVSDNSASNDISKDTIYTTQITAEDPFKSGQTASDLAHAVNQLNVSFFNALANLKNTAIAKAINVTGKTFTAVIAELSSIVDYKGWSKTLTSPGKVMIPKGYHSGDGFVDASSLMVVPKETLVLNEPVQKTNCVNYAFVSTSGLMKTPTQNYDITRNGNYDITNYKSVKVNVSAGSLGTFSTTDTVTKTVAGASSKSFYCSVSDLSFTDLGVDVCDYADCAVSVNSPIISVNGNNVTITPAIVYVRFTGGTVFGLPGGVGARDSNRPYLTRAIPTTVYYT